MKTLKQTSLFLGGLAIMWLLMYGLATFSSWMGFPIQLLIISSSSMEPLLNPGDVIIIEQVNPSTIKIDDIISFSVDVNHDGLNEMVTHVVGQIEVTVSGYELYTHPYQSLILDPWIIPEEDILGVHRGTIPWIGLLKSFISSPYGISWLILQATFLLWEHSLHKKTSSK